VSVDASLVVDHKIAFFVTHDVEDAADFLLQVLDFVAAGVEIDDSDRPLGICTHDKGIHMITMERANPASDQGCLLVLNEAPG
jgi:hypothetical protein